MGFCNVCVLVFLLVPLVCMVAILFHAVVGVFVFLRDDVIYSYTCCEARKCSIFCSCLIVCLSLGVGTLFPCSFLLLFCVGLYPVASVNW